MLMSIKDKMYTDTKKNLQFEFVQYGFWKPRVINLMVIGHTLLTEEAAGVTSSNLDIIVQELVKESLYAGKESMGSFEIVVDVFWFRESRYKDGI